MGRKKTINEATEVRFDLTGPQRTPIVIIIPPVLTRPGNCCISVGLVISKPLRAGVAQR